MKASPTRLLAITCLVAFTQPGVAQTVFDPTTSFSISNSNPNSTWTYGWMNTGFTTFTSFTTTFADVDGDIAWIGWYSDRTPTIWKNSYGGTTDGVAPGQISLHPGQSNEPCVLRWTAPSGYTSAQVTGQFLPGDSGSMTVAVRKNGSVVWGPASNSGSFDFSVSLSANDYLDFAVYGGYGHGNTPLELTITAIPEPATCATLIGLGALGLVMWRRRRSEARLSADQSH